MTILKTKDITRHHAPYIEQHRSHRSVYRVCPTLKITTEHMAVKSEVGSSNINQQEMLTHQSVAETDPDVSNDLCANEDGNRLQLDVPVLTENNIISISQEFYKTSRELTSKAKTQDKVDDLMLEDFSKRELKK